MGRPAEAGRPFSLPAGFCGTYCAVIAGQGKVRTMSVW
jgi:hypothetical protein